MFRVMDFAVEVKAQQPGAVRFEVEPGKIYPVALADLREAVETRRSVDGILAQYRSGAAQLPDKAWELALIPRDQVQSEDLPTRTAALELARVWFTELLHRSVGNAPMELRILKDPDWRL